MQTTKSEDGRRVWDQKADQAEKSRVTCIVVSMRLISSGSFIQRHTKSLGKVSTSGSFGLEEQSLVLFRSESHGHLATQGCTIAAGAVLGQAVVDLLGRHCWWSLYRRGVVDVEGRAVWKG